VPSLIYGEVSYSSFIRTLRSLDLAPGGVFVDLGAGSGKPCIAAALVGGFREIVGIETLGSLCSIAQGAVARYAALQRATFSIGARSTPSVRILHGSFLDPKVRATVPLPEGRVAQTRF
jgi:predicted RNA methylase